MNAVYSAQFYKTASASDKINLANWHVCAGLFALACLHWIIQIGMFALACSHGAVRLFAWTDAVSMSMGEP